MLRVQIGLAALVVAPQLLFALYLVVELCWRRRKQAMMRQRGDSDP